MMRVPTKRLGAFKGRIRSHQEAIPCRDNLVDLAIRRADHLATLRLLQHPFSAIDHNCQYSKTEQTRLSEVVRPAASSEAGIHPLSVMLSEHRG